MHTGQISGVPSNTCTITLVHQLKISEQLQLPLLRVHANPDFPVSYHSLCQMYTYFYPTIQSKNTNRCKIQIGCHTFRESVDYRAAFLLCTTSFIYVITAMRKWDGQDREVILFQISGFLHCGISVSLHFSCLKKKIKEQESLECNFMNPSHR